MPPISSSDPNRTFMAAVRVARYWASTCACSSRQRIDKRRAKKTYPRSFRRAYLCCHPALVTEGCLYSIFRCGAGSGGRGVPPQRRRCGAWGPAAQVASSRRASRAPRGPVMAEAGNRSQVRRPDLGSKAVERQPANSKGEAGCLKGKSTGGDAEQAYKHRARDALGFGGLAACPP
jgi:hypothetical protein